jgi:autotransporter-associated beta strand protein
VDFASQTSIGGGEIYVDNPANLYTGTTRFEFGNIHIAADGSTGVGGQWEMASGTVVVGSNVTNSRAVNFEASSTIDTNGFNVTLNGPITGFGSSFAAPSSSGLTKKGGGTLTLTSLANNLAGAVNVNGGTLLINGNMGASSTNSLTVNTGATLGGTGTIYRNTVIAAGGAMSPGNGGPGLLTIWGSLNMGPLTGAATTLNVDLNGPVAGSGYDQIQTFLQNSAVINQVQLGTGSGSVQANLVTSLNYAPSTSDVFWLIVNTNNYMAGLSPAIQNATTGAFAGMADGSTITLGTYGGVTYTGTISYHGDFDSNNWLAPATGPGAGNDVVIYNIVPAPGSIALLGIGGLLATRRKRRTA